MHGFGLHFILSKPLMNNSARLAFSRPLRESKVVMNLKKEDETDILKIKNRWSQIENLSERDRFMLALFKKYSKRFSELQ